MVQVPWLVSATACGLLALTTSEKANTLQASIDADLYKSSGDLQVAWVKPESPGNLVALLAIAGVVGSLYQAFKSQPEIGQDDPIEQKVSRTKSEKTPEEVESTESEPIAETVSDIENTPSQSESDSPSVKDAPKVASLYDRAWNHRKRHLMVPAETGAGKTTLVLGLIQYFWQRSKQTVEVYGSTVKPAPWLGLEFEKAPDGLPRIITLNVTNSQSVEILIRRLRWLQSRMQQRQKQRAKAEAENKSYNPNRIILIADEWNSTLALAKQFDKRLAREFAIAKAEKQDPLPSPPYAADELKALMESILLMGREDECAEWVFGQDHQVQNAGFNTGYQKSFGILVPFRKGAMQALEQALIGRSPVLPSAIGKTILQQGYDAIDSNPDATFVYSSLNGHEILEVPHLPNIKREKLYGAESAVSATAESTKQPESAISESEESDPWEETDG